MFYTDLISWLMYFFTCLHLLQLVALFSVLVWLVWWYLFWFWGMMAWSLELGQMKILINLNFWADLGTISNYAIKVNIKYEEWKKIWIHRWIIRCLENQPMKIQNTFMLNLQYLVLWWGFVSMAMALGGKVAWDFGKWWEKWEVKRIVFVFKQQRYHWVELSQKIRRKKIKLINWPIGQLGFGDRWSNKDKCEYKMWNSINTKLLKRSIARMIIQMFGDQIFNIFYN